MTPFVAFAVAFFGFVVVVVVLVVIASAVVLCSMTAVVACLRNNIKRVNGTKFDMKLGQICLE